MKKRINFIINSRVLESLDEKAEEMGLTRTALLIIIINDFLNLKGEKNI